MIFFSDFDGTLTADHHQMTPTFFEILNLVNRNDHEFIIVSGRSVSWGHFLLTHFPIRHCIMEGGGVLLTKQDPHKIEQELLVHKNHVSKLKQFTEKLELRFPDLALSADSFGRLTDRAIEYHHMEDHMIEEVTQFMNTEDISFSQSNVHINFWSGPISKYKGVKDFLKRKRPSVSMHDCWYFGDAPNDESMFENFPNCVGVSNINRCLDRLKSHPRIILEGVENEGDQGVLNFIKTLI